MRPPARHRSWSGGRNGPAARSLLAHADAIAACWEQARIDLYAQRDEPAGLLWVCGFPVAVSTLLAPLVAALRSPHSRLTVRIRESELHSSFDLVFNGEADLAVVEAAPGSHTRFDQQPLLDAPFDLVVPDAHPFAGRQRVGLAEAATEDWVVPLPGSTCHAHTLTACSAAGFTPTVAHHVLDWDAIAAVVAHGLGVALVPGWRASHRTCRSSGCPARQPQPQAPHLHPRRWT